MMTPDQARNYANAMVPNSPVATMLRSLAEQVEVLTAERDKLTAERDAAREAVINNCARVMTVTAERDALKDAARLALGSLELIRSQVKAWDHGDAAIAALKAVL